MTERALQITPSAGDVRENRAWTPRQALKNHAIYALVRVALAACALLPPALLRALGRGAGRLAYAVLPAERRAARANLARALPALGEAERRELTVRVFARLGEHLGDAVSMLRGERNGERASSASSSLLAFDARDRGVLDAARAEGRGVLLASAHLGPWERVAATLVAHGVPLTALAREAYDPRLTALYERLRAPRGVRAIYRGAPGAAARIVRVLKSGGVLGVPMDLRSRVPSIDAPFLGHPAPTPVGPARIALRTGAAVVVATCAPADTAASTPGAPRLAVTVTRIPTADLAPGPDGEHALTCRINDALSARILALPEAWVWMHRRFFAR